MRMRGLGAIAGHFRRDGSAKIAYPSQDKALAARTDTLNFTAYECSLCGQWHLGHRSGEKRRAKARHRRNQKGGKQ